MLRNAWLFMCSAVLSCLVACGAPASPAAVLPPASAAPTVVAPEQSKVGGTVNRIAISDPETLDLHQTSNPIASTIFGWIYEPLVAQAPDGNYVGLLAESWMVSSDNKLITFKLRKDVKFSDGSPFNAAAVKFT